MGLSLGLLARNVLHKLPVPIPYTVWMMLFGLGIGKLSLIKNLHGWSIVQSVIASAEISPHTLLTLFLPALIFESAFSLHFHVFYNCMVQIMLLAVPGVAISTALTALLSMLFPMLDPTWGGDDWKYGSYGLLFGVILSATDPVAVVALLKQLGASKRLGTISHRLALLGKFIVLAVLRP